MPIGLVMGKMTIVNDGAGTVARGTRRMTRLMTSHGNEITTGAGAVGRRRRTMNMNAAPLEIRI